jgi:hypothetical protein
VQLLQLIIGGIAQGCIYGLIALGVCAAERFADGFAGSFSPPQGI